MRLKIEGFKKKTKTRYVVVRVSEETFKKLKKLDINISGMLRDFLEKLVK